MWEGIHHDMGPVHLYDPINLRPNCSKNITNKHINICMYMAMTTLYLHRDFSKDAHHSKVFKLATWDPYSYAGDPWAALGSPGTTKEALRLGPGPWPGPAHGPRPWPSLFWFLGILRLHMDLQRMDMGPKLLI